MIIFVVIVFSISIGLLVVGNGYDMYKDAISKIPLTEKVETIKEKENYTKIEEVPEIYIKAVISVEDHRFYKHHGIDIIAISRATINDIKAMSFVEGGSTITTNIIFFITFISNTSFFVALLILYNLFELFQEVHHIALLPKNVLLKFLLLTLKKHLLLVLYLF